MSSPLREGARHQWLPEWAKLFSQPVHVDEALPEEPIAAAARWLSDEVDHGECEHRRRPQVAEAERVYQHQPADLIAVYAGAARPDGTAKQVAHQIGR